MNSAWTTSRGDNWWYEGASIRASAGASANIVSIGDVAATKDHFTEADLHQFLCDSVERFSGSSLMVNLNSPDVELALRSLKARGLISYEIVASTYSKDAKLLSVAPILEQVKDAVKAPAEKKWFFW
ncbi:hypothetical protein GCM10007418_30620 [Halopseudomonas salina]|uniref:STAS domain-containing protein n=1 Tax=Halopseudomonas salina TaxID=1323744 RepID=A0ABQ1Q269_9GAMM|nr:hypothetical protein GCM10007418_30620 [Halopseudomonas salina]